MGGQHCKGFIAHVETSRQPSKKCVISGSTLDDEVPKYNSKFARNVNGKPILNIAETPTCAPINCNS